MFRIYKRMEFIMTNKNKETYDDGDYLSRLIWMADLGIHEYEYPKGSGEMVGSRKILLTFEIDELMEDGRPFVQNIELTWNPMRKTKSQKDLFLFLEGALGENFDDEDRVREFKLSDLLGETFKLRIKSQQRGKSSWQEIELCKISNKKKYPHETENEKIFFMMPFGDSRQYEKLPKWIRKKIRESISFNNMKNDEKNSWKWENMTNFDEEDNLYGKTQQSANKTASNKSINSDGDNPFESDDIGFDDDIPF